MPTLAKNRMTIGKAIKVTVGIKPVGFVAIHRAVVIPVFRGVQQAVAIIVARQLGLSDTVVALVALAVFLGHLYPVFLKFKGGKGVATAAGVLLALDPVLGLAVAATWLLVAYVSRYSSLAALIAAVAAPFYAALMHGATNQTIVVGLLGMALIGKHWQNIQRLMAGQETKIGGKKKA